MTSVSGRGDRTSEVTWNAATATIPITIIVYPGEEKDKFEVTYKQPASGPAPSDATNPAKVTDLADVNTNFTLTASTTSKANWTFKGWKYGSTTIDPATTSTTNIAAFGGTGSIEVEAVWSYAPQYTIKYNLNGGGGSAPANQTGAYTGGNQTATALATPSSATAPSGKHFVGWSWDDKATAPDDTKIYAAGATPALSALHGTTSTDNDTKGDLNITLYAIWAAPAEIKEAHAPTATYKKNDPISLSDVLLSDGKTVTAGSSRWTSDVTVLKWAMGNGMGHITITETADNNKNSYTIPDKAAEGDWVWVLVKGNGVDGPLDIDNDISKTEKWLPVVQLGAAKATLTAQVVYYDASAAAGNQYKTSKPSSVTNEAKINGQSGTFTAQYPYPQDISLSTSHVGDELTFVGWSTRQDTNLTGDCITGDHDPRHNVITTTKTDYSVTVHMDNTSTNNTDGGMPVATTVYAIYAVKQSATLTVNFAKSNGASTPTYTAWDGDADGDGTADAKYGVSPTSATTGLFGGDTAYLTASINTNDYDYKFIGWMKADGSGAPDGTLITAATTAADAKPLSSVSVGATGGMGAATFTMPTTPVATTIFAVYEPIPTYDLIVESDAGIEVAPTVSLIRGGTAQPVTLTENGNADANGVVTYNAIKVRDTDTVTVTSAAASSTYTVNGFDVNPTNACTYTGSNNSVTLANMKAAVTVTAKSKLAPPELELTATDGAGKMSGTTFSNTILPKVDVTNNGPSKAVIKSVTKSGADADHFTKPNDPTKLGNATAELAASGTGSLTFVPDTSNTWAVGNYFFNVTITYTNENYKDADGNEIEYTKTVAVKYVVSENEEYTGKVTVLLDGKPAVKLNGTSVVPGDETATVKLGPDASHLETNAHNVDKDGVYVPMDATETTKAQVFTVPQTIQVAYGGKTYTVPTQMSKSNPNVTVNLYTVKINLANNSTETAALVAASGKTPTVTLGVTGATDKPVVSTSGHPAGWELSSVLLEGASVTISATVGSGTTALNTGYSFDKWAEGSYDVDGTGSTPAVTLSDISSASHTFTVAGTTTYTAHLKQDNYKVLTYHANAKKAPHVVSTVTDAAVTNMPSSDVTANDSTKVSAVVPVLPGYKLKGWSTNKDQTAAAFDAAKNATDYAAGDTVSLSSGNVDLYAIWEDASITIGTVPAVPDGVYGSSYTFDLAAAMTVAPSGVALAYSATSLPAGLSVNATTGSVTGIPRTTGMDNDDGSAAAAGFPAKSFMPTFTVTLAQDYHADAFKVKAILVADGSGAAASQNKVSVTEGTETKQVDGNEWTYHTAAKDKLAVDKAETTITGIAVSNVTAGGALSDATFTVSVTGPRYVGGSGSGWNFAYTATLEYTKDGKSAGTNNAGSATFSSDGTGGNTFKAEGDTVVTASFTPEAQDVNGNTSDDAFTSFDAFDADHNKNLQSHVWKAPEDKTQNVKPGTSTGEMKVKLGDKDSTDTLALAKSWTYQTSDSTPLNARKGYAVANPVGTNGFVSRDNTNGVDKVAGKQFTLKNTGSIATGELKYTFGKGNSSPFALDTALTTANPTIAAGGYREFVVKVDPSKAPGPGTYTDTLTISNSASGVSVSIFLSITVDDPMKYDAYVTVNTQAPGAVKATTTALPDGLGIATTAGNFTATRITDNNDANKGKYKLTGLSVGTTYQLKVTGPGGGAYTVPGVSLSYTAATPAPTATIDLYQVAFATHKPDHTATETASATVVYTGTPAGAGWYVDGQYASMDTYTGYSVTANDTTTNYVFSNSWTKSVTDTSITSATTPTEGNSDVATSRSFTTQITQPTTFYAHYKEKDTATVTLHYEPNSGADTGVMVPADQTVTLNASGKFTISSITPTRTGYVFKHWASAVKADGTAADSATTYAVGTSDGPSTGADATVYAIWDEGEVEGPTEFAWSADLPSGVYGESYTYQVAVPPSTDGAAVTLTARYSADGGTNWTNGLPGGLYLNKDTGLITGKPYMVSEDHSVTDVKNSGFLVEITATHSYWNGVADTGHSPASTRKLENLRLKVAKHPVTLTGTSVTNVVAGQAVTTGNYETTVVTLPLYGGKDASNNDIWNTVTTGGTPNAGGSTFNAFTETVDLPDDDGTTNVGTLSITNNASDKFDATNDTTVNLKYTPSGSAKDAHNNVHSAIYKEATTSIKAPGGGADYSMKIKLGNETEDSDYAQSKSWTYQTSGNDPKNAKMGYSVDATTETGYVTAGASGAPDSVAAKKFVLKNTGNQPTGTLTYTFGAGDNSAFEVVGYDDATKKSALVATLPTTAGSNTRDVLVKVKTGKGPGTYTDTLVITNTNGNSVSAKVTFTVEKKDVPVTISTYLWDVGVEPVEISAADYPNTKAPAKASGNNSTAEKSAINAQKKQLTGGTVKLVDINDPTKTVTASWNATDSVYTASIDYDTTYNLVINGYTVPGVTFSRTKTAGGAYLYQVTTAYAPVDNTTTADVNEAGATQAPKVENSTGDASAATANAATNSIYVVVGEVATVTEQNKAASGFSYKELQDTTKAAAPVTKTNAQTYTTVVNAPVKFTAVYTKGYTLTYDPNGANWVTPSNGGTASAVAEAVESGSVTVKAPGVLSKEISGTTYTGFAKANYTFKGWSTSASTTPAAWDAAYAETGHTKDGVTVYAAGDSINISADATLYAIWEPVSDGLKFEGDTIKVAHYDKLADKVVAATGAVGTPTYARTESPLATLPGGTTGGNANITFDATNHKFTSGSNAVKYDAATPANNSATTTVTATDTNGATVSANFTIEVVKAETKITTPWDGVNTDLDNGGVKAGDPFDFTKLTVPSGKTLTVSAYKTDETTVNSDVDFDEAPTAANGTTGNTNGLGGQWTVTKEDGTPVTNFLPGTNKYVVTFKPNDEGFKPSSATIELTLEKLIKEVTVSLTFPVDGKEPSKDAEIENTATAPTHGENTSVVATDKSPKAIDTDAVVDGDVIWTYTAKKDNNGKDVFDRRDPVTAIVKIKPKTADGWKFVTTTTTAAGKTTYDFVGNYSDLGTPSKADKDVPTVTVLNVDANGESATLLYTWLGEDTAARNIKIKVTAPTDGGTRNKEATPMGTPLGSFVTTDDDSDYTTEWYKKELKDVNKDNYTTLGEEATQFSAADGGKYVVIVTATVNDGYYFESNNSDATSKLAALNDANAYATINDMNAKVLAVTEDTTNNKRATVVTLAVEFTVNASDVVGLVSEDSKLDYYVMTDSNATTDMTHKTPAVTKAEDKHYDASAIGHNSGFGFTLTAGGSSDTVKIYAIDKNGAKALTSNVILFVDGATGTAGAYDTSDILLSKKETTGSGDSEKTTYSTPGYTFLPKSDTDLTSALDGKTLYAAYVSGNGTKTPTIASDTAGAATSMVVAVGTLHVKPLEAKSIATVSNWSVDANKKFQIDDTKTTTVTFNTGDAMANTVATVSYAARAESLATSVTAPVAAADTAKTRPSYYYMLDVGGNGLVTDADDIELTDELDVSSYGGKSVYICYTDVNGHLVTAKAGVIGANFTVDIDDENGQDPEYGDKLTGEPVVPDPDHPGKTKPATPSDPKKPFTYQWEKEKPDGTWEPIPGATSPEYVPGKTDVGDDIRVSVTDPGTGTTVPSAPQKIQKRSINFDVAAVDKRYDGDFYNDDHSYTTADFTAKRVEKVWNKTTKQFDVAKKDSVDTLFGGLLLGDAVTIAPYNDPATSGDNDVDWNDVKTIPAGMADKHYTGRPTYKTYDTVTKKYVDNPAVGSQIRWPWVLEKDTVTDAAAGTKIVSHAVDATDGYDLDGADKNYYRLVPQDAMIPRGEITDGTVTHVDVSFKEWPTYDHLIPSTPMGVTDERETMAGEKAHTDADTVRQTYTAEWYEVVDGKTFDPEDTDTYTAVTTTKFDSNVRYAVKVTVKPQTGYNYELDETKNPYTRFYFHFGEYADEKKVEVTDNQHDAPTKIGQGVWKHDASGEAVYTMYYTFDTVALPKIAYVNVTIPQPVAEVVRATSVNVIQLIGTDNKVIDNTSDSVVSGGTPTWEYVSATAGDGTKTWTTATVANGGFATGNKFVAEKEYRVTFTLTASGYEYLYKTVDSTTTGVRFVASGEGELKNANIDGTHTLDGSSTPAIVNSEIIESVVTSALAATGKEQYTVTITYKPVKSGKADLMDVVVEASPATKAGEEMTGPAVDSDKPYALLTASGAVDTTKSKWSYWDKTANSNAGGWAAASANTGLDKDGKFLAGYDYRVEAQVELTDTTHYQITDKTKFYIAGYEVKTTDDVELHNPNTGTAEAPVYEKALTKNADGSYKLVKTFSIPVEDIGVVSVTHNLPLLSGATVPQSPNGWSDSAIVNIATNSDEWVKLGTDYDTIKDTLFTATGTAVTEGTDTFVEDTYYRVTSLFTPVSGYQFKTGNTDTTKNTVVVINGVAVNVDGDAKEVKNGKGETVAYVKAVSDGGNVKAMLVAKVQSDAINPIELKQDKIVPTTGADIPEDVFATLDPDEPDYEVDTAKHNGGKGTWEYLDTEDTTDGADGTWKEVNTTTKAGLDENGKFKGDTKYRVTVGVKVKGDKVFAANGVTKGSVTVGSLVYNAKPVTVAEDADDLTVHRKTADLTIEFNPTSGSIRNVSQVNVSFKEVPTFSHNSLPVMGVTDDRETQRGEASGDEQAYTATWYKGAPNANFDPTAPKDADGNTMTAWDTVTNPAAAGAKTYTNGTYTVVVKVKPKAGYRYALTADDEKDKTRFYFHFGEDKTVEVNTAASGDVVKGLKEDSGVYYMWYTFKVVDLPKIAYVNVSVPQPVAEVAPGALSVIQVIGTDNQPIDVSNVTGTAAWEYLDTEDTTESAAGTWKPASAGAGLDSVGTGRFQAEKQYRVKFTLTAGGGYEYLYTDDGKGIRFVASGEGELEKANLDAGQTWSGSSVINKQIIESVVTSDTNADATDKSGKSAYDVVITYKPVKGGKADLMDVVVEASPATQAGVTLDGPKVSADKPYELVKLADGSAVDTTKSKWSYWTGSAWAPVVVDADDPDNNVGVDADGKFLAGYDYRVEGKVVLTDTTHYRITDKTRFYIAGYEVKTTDEVELHNTTSETAVSADKPAVDHIYPDGTVFTLVKTFSIPKEKTSAEIIITYPEPEVGKTPVPKLDPETTLWTYQYLSDGVEVSTSSTAPITAPQTDGSIWYKTELKKAPTDVDDFEPDQTDDTKDMTRLTAAFDYDTYYMVEGRITSDDDHDFPEGNVYVTINGVRVLVGGAMGKKYDANDDANDKHEIGWAMAKWAVDNKGTDDTSDDVTYIKARYIAKTADADSKTIYKVTASVDKPGVNKTISDQLDLESALFDNDFLATTNVKYSDKVKWSVSDRANGTYQPVDTTTTTQFEKGKYYKAEFEVWADKGKADDPDDDYTFESKDIGTADANGQTPGNYVAFRINGVKGTKGWGVNDEVTWDEATDSETGIKVRTEQVGGDPDKYKITVWFPLNGEPEDLTVIGLTGTPAHGQTAGATFIKVKDGEPYQINAPHGAEEKQWDHWDDSTNTWVPMADGDAFKAGEYYRAVMNVVLKEDQKNLYKFTAKTPGEVNDETAKSAGDLPADKGQKDEPRTTIVHRETDGVVDSITLAQEFFVAKTPTVVHVSAPVPKADDKAHQIEKDIQLVTVAPYDDANRYDLVPIPGVGIDGEPFDYQARWYELGSDDPMDREAFVAGKTYYLKVTAKMKDVPYIFMDERIGYKWLDPAQGNNEKADAAVLYTNDPTWKRDKNGDTIVSYVAFEYTLPAPEAKVIPGFADQPERGKALSSIWTDEKNFEPVNSFWSTDPDGNDTVAVGTTAAAETTYYATIDVIPKDGVLVTPEYSFNGKGPNGNFIKHELLRTTEDGKNVYRLTYKFDPTGAQPSTGGGTITVENPVVYYHLKDQGVTDDPTAEKVRKNGSPKQVPKVKAMTGLKFLGWSEVDPGTLPAGKLPTLVDPTTFKITADKWFYAVYEQGTEVDHLHYVIGFPNGTFGPDAKITRAEVATIIARSCLEGFVEGANYGNPGNYSDVTTHWAFSAIAFCAREGVFNGYEDGTFRPDRYITRQELATVVSRLAGIQTSQGVPFNDRNQIASWAMNGVYTAYANGWIKGYEDGTFQPERDISRAETVKIFNGYLKRGVDAKGLEGLKEYVHTGVASNNTENGHDEYMTWPDVPKTHWAYHEIIEAANDHNYHWQDEAKKTPPEDWDEVYIDEKWRYNDNASDGAEKRDENMTLQKTFTVTYLVSSNGVTYDAITETVDRFASPKPENMPVAVPNEGYRFVGWSSTDPSTGTITLVDPTASSVTSDEWFYAVFEEDKPYTLPVYTVTYVIGDLGSYDGATVEQVEMYQAPSVSGLPQPTASEGYRFAGWSETDPATGSYTIVDPTANYVTGDKTFYAVYEKADEPYHLPVYTVTYVIGEYGSYDGATVEQVEMFQAPSLDVYPHPVANEGYRFVGWSETDPASGSYSIMDPTANYVTGDKTFYAVYEAV